jgi:signal transduction histidine kinase
VELAAQSLGPREDTGERFVEELLHDMGQSVSMIFALSGSVASDENLPVHLRRRLRQIDDQAAWLADLLRDGLALAEAPPERLPIVDVGQVVTESLTVARSAFEGRISFTRGSCALASGEPVLLRRAVANVVDNATRAAGPQGRVRVGVRRRARSVDVVVEDDGPGFGRIQTQRALGLQVALRVMKRYGGSLRIGSSTLGGASVHLSLPAAEDLPAAAG